MEKSKTNIFTRLLPFGDKTKGERMFVWSPFRVAGNGIILSKYKFADIILSQMFEKIFEKLQKTKWYLDAGSTERFANFEMLFKNYFAQIILMLFKDGFVCFSVDENKISVSKKSKNSIEKYSQDYFLYGKSTYDICKDLLKYIDNILNASNTTLERLGAFIAVSPEANTPDGVEYWQEKQRKEIEDVIQKDYGALDKQNNIMLLSRASKLQSVGIDASKMQLSQRLHDAIELLCGAVKVPYDQLPIAGASIYANQEQSLIQLYDTCESWANWFAQLAERFGIIVSYEIEGKPASNLLTEWQGKNLIVQTLTAAITSGILTTDEARGEVDKYFTLKERVDEPVLPAKEFGVGGTQSITAILADPNISIETKRGLLSAWFGLDDEQINKILL
jgi:hypothetical protein